MSWRHKINSLSHNLRLSREVNAFSGALVPTRMDEHSDSEGILLGPRKSSHCRVCKVPLIGKLIFHLLWKACKGVILALLNLGNYSLQVKN